MMIKSIKNISLFSWLILAMVACVSNKKQGVIVPSMESLQNTFYLKNKYLIDGNKESLKTLIHEDILFCHSNCWVEDLSSILLSDEIKQLDYKEINVKEIKSKIVGNTGVIQGQARFIIEYNEQPLDLHLCFVETYIFQNGKWLLLARQSSKVPENK